MLLDPKTLRYAGALSGAVLTKGLLIFGGYHLGAWLDARLGSYPFLTVGLITVAGALGLWYLLVVAERNRR